MHYLLCTEYKLIYSTHQPIARKYHIEGMFIEIPLTKRPKNLPQYIPLFDVVLSKREVAAKQQETVYIMHLFLGLVNHKWCIGEVKKGVFIVEKTAFNEWLKKAAIKHIFV